MSTEWPVAKEPKRERGKQRVALLLDAAAALFTEKGYEATTMTEIAARAQAAIGSLYQFFPSKQALAEALFDRDADARIAAFDELVDGGEGLTPAELAGRFVQLVGRLCAVQDVTATLPGIIDLMADRRKPLRAALRERIARTLRMSNPKLDETEAARAAVVVAHLIKTMKQLAVEEQQTGLPLLEESQKVLTLYLASLRSG